MPKTPGAFSPNGNSKSPYPVPMSDANTSATLSRPLKMYEGTANEFKIELSRKRTYEAQGQEGHRIKRTAQFDSHLCQRTH